MWEGFGTARNICIDMVHEDVRRAVPDFLLLSEPESPFIHSILLRLDISKKKAWKRNSSWSMSGQLSYFHSSWGDRSTFGDVLSPSSGCLFGRCSSVVGKGCCSRRGHTPKKVDTVVGYVGDTC